MKRVIVAFAFVVLIFSGCGDVENEINNLPTPVILFEEVGNGDAIILRDGSGKLHVFVEGDYLFSNSKLLIKSISDDFEPGDVVIGYSGKVQGSPGPPLRSNPAKTDGLKDLDSIDNID